MKLNLRELNYYFLTTGNQKDRSDHMFEIFKEYNLKEINPLMGISKVKSGSIGVSRMIDSGLNDQKKDIPFQPFVLMEDDVSFMGDYPDHIDIPEDTDLMYLGLSPWGMPNGKTRGDKVIKVDDNVDGDLFRVYNMLSTHAIIICSPRGANTYQKCVMETYYSDIGYDIVLAKTLPHLKAYAFKTPLLYQDKKYGGAAYFNGIEDTKITLSEMITTEYIPSNLDDNLFSISTMKIK